MTRLNQWLLFSLLLMLPAVGSTASVDKLASQWLLQQSPSSAIKTQVRIELSNPRANKCLELKSITPVQRVQWPGKGLIKFTCASPRFEQTLGYTTYFNVYSWQPTGNVPKGRLLNTKDLTQVEIDAASAPPNMVSTTLDWVGKEARRNLPANRPVKHSDLAEPIVVKRGQRVSLIAKFGKVEAKMLATVLQDGRVGDSVGVKIVHSQRLLQGVVIDSGTVSVNSRTKRMGTIANK